MVFAPDTEVALGAAAALVNTAPGERGVEELRTRADLDRFVREQGWTGSRTRDRGELESVRELRPRLRELWEVDEDHAVEIVNGLLREAGALPQLVRHDDWDYHLHAVGLRAPLADRMAVEAAMAFVDVIRMDELDRLHVCAATDCGDVLVDLSKNHSRRFCSTTCANRANATAFRARRARGR